MNIYCLAMHDKADSDALLRSTILGQFAQFSALGTWSSGGLCNSCGNSTQDYIEPLLVQWEPSANVIGDFSWDGPWGYVFVVTEAVADFLRQQDFGCRFRRVEYVTPEKPRSRQKCVPFPYTGPKQFWAKCDSFIDLDQQASNVHLKSDCPVCGETKYTFRYERIVIPRSNWNGENMFRITTNGKSLATFVTDQGRRIIEHAGFTNVAFRFAGEIV